MNHHARIILVGENEVLFKAFIGHQVTVEFFPSIHFIPKHSKLDVTLEKLTKLLEFEDVFQQN